MIANKIDKHAIFLVQLAESDTCARAFSDTCYKKMHIYIENQSDHIMVGFGLVFRFKTNCPHLKPESTGGVPFVWVFLKDPSPYLRKLWRKSPW